MVTPDRSVGERVGADRPLPSVQVAQQRDLCAVVDELVQHVEDIAGPRAVCVVYAHWTDHRAESFVVGEGEMRVPPHMRSVELIEGFGCSGRGRGARSIRADGLALRWYVQQPRGTVLAVHVDQMPETPGQRGEW